LLTQQQFATFDKSAVVKEYKDKIARLNKEKDTVVKN